MRRGARPCRPAVCRAPAWVGHVARGEFACTEETRMRGPPGRGSVGAVGSTTVLEVVTTVVTYARGVCSLLHRLSVRSAGLCEVARAPASCLPSLWAPHAARCPCPRVSESPRRHLSWAPWLPWLCRSRGLHPRWATPPRGCLPPPAAAASPALQAADSRDRPCVRNHCFCNLSPLFMDKTMHY